MLNTDEYPDQSYNEIILTSRCDYPYRKCYKNKSSFPVLLNDKYAVCYSLFLDVFPNLSTPLIYLLLGMLIKDELLAYKAFTLYTTIPYKGDLLYDHCLRIIAYGTLNMPFHVYQHHLTCKFYFVPYVTQSCFVCEAHAP